MGSKGQAGGFFKVDEENREFTLHFSTRSQIANGKLNRWHAMTFRRDFREWLADYGCLPSTFYAKHANDVQRRKGQMNMLKAKLTQMMMAGGEKAAGETAVPSDSSSSKITILKPSASTAVVGNTLQKKSETAEPGKSANRLGQLMAVARTDTSKSTMPPP